MAIVDSGTSKHILQCRTLLANAQEAHVAVSSFAGDTSCSTYSGDLLCTVRTEGGQLLPLSDTSSALVVPDAKRPLWSVRHAQLAGHEIVLGAKPGLLLQGNPRYFVPFINCPETGLWLIRLLPPPTLHNRIYPIHPATNSGRPPCRQVPVSQDDGITPPTSKRLKPITCPVCIAKVRRANRPTPSRGSAAANRPTEPWQDVYTDLSGKVRTASVTGVTYFVFVDSYSGSKQVEFLTSKKYFIFGYKRFISYLGRHPKALHSDLGTEILNKELTAYLEANHTRHVVCSKDEHASIGVAENSIGVLRTSAWYVGSVVYTALADAFKTAGVVKAACASEACASGLQFHALAAAAAGAAAKGAAAFGTQAWWNPGGAADCRLVALFIRGRHGRAHRGLGS